MLEFGFDVTLVITAGGAGLTLVLEVCVVAVEEGRGSRALERFGAIVRGVVEVDVLCKVVKTRSLYGRAAQ